MGDIDMPEAEYVQNYIMNRSVAKVPDAAFFIHIYFQLHAFLSFVFVQCFGVNMKGFSDALHHPSLFFSGFKCTHL